MPSDPLHTGIGTTTTRATARVHHVYAGRRDYQRDRLPQLSRSICWCSAKRFDYHLDDTGIARRRCARRFQFLRSGRFDGQPLCKYYNPQRGPQLPGYLDSCHLF